MHLQSPTPLRRRSAAAPTNASWPSIIVLAAATITRLFLLLTTQLNNTACVEAACPPDGCGPYGRCVRGTLCICNLGYDGDDCSIPVDICPGPVVPDEALLLNTNGGGYDEKEASSCLNGGQCVAQDAIDEATGEKKLEWRCDCSTAVGDAAADSSSSSSAFAGFRCEYRAETSCVITDNINNSANNKNMSTYAFCVNGGECFHMIRDGEAHPGCGGCPGFEGRHCQYLHGTAPVGELDFAQQQASDNDTDVGLSGLAVAFITALCLILLSAVGYLLFVNHTRTKARAAVSSAAMATTATTTKEGDAVNDSSSSTREARFQNKNESSTAKATETAADAEAVYMEAMEHQHHEDDLKLTEEEDTEETDDDESANEPKNEII